MDVVVVAVSVGEAKSSAGRSNHVGRTIIGAYTCNGAACNRGAARRGGCVI